MSTKKVVVVGAGPAGMMAAARAATKGNKVILAEKNKFLGKKLLITGKGRCNITNNADISEFINNVPVNGKFLYSAFYSFTNTDLISLINKLGVETKVERGGRVFPASDMSKDVLNALKNYLSELKVTIYNGEVESITQDGDLKKVTFCDKKYIMCDAVVIATGGMSYPLTGSTGDGYRFAKSLGHTIVPPKPSLVPIELCGEEYKDFQGLSLKNVAIKVMKNNKEFYSDFGEMIFTHFGVSGPVILSASSHIKNEDFNNLSLVIDLKPALSDEMLDKRILRDFEEFKNRDFVNSLKNLLPQKLIMPIIKRSGINPRKKINEITKLERANLLHVIKNFDFKLKCLRPVEEAIITSGGVAVNEINPKTMESKLVSGIYFAGELIDADAYTGGFNLQIAFSTGFLAGDSI